MSDERVVLARFKGVPHDGVPAGQGESCDIGVATLDPAAVFGGVAAHQMDVDEMRGTLLPHVAPAEPAFAYRIDAVRHHRAAEPQIGLRHGVRDSVAGDADLGHAGVSHGLLDRVDPQIERVQPCRERSGDAGLAGAWKPTEDHKDRESVGGDHTRRKV